jgi:hypothetical protein
LQGPAEDAFGPARQGVLKRDGVEAQEDFAQTMPLERSSGEAQPVHQGQIAIVGELGDGSIAPGTAQDRAADQAQNGGQGMLSAQTAARVGNFGKMGEQTTGSKREHGKTPP